MIEQVLRLRVGDRLPAFFAQIVDQNGTVIPLTNMRAWLVLRAVTTDNVFGEASPYIVEISVVDEAQGTVSYDWLQEEVDAAEPGRYEISVRLINATTGVPLFEVPSGRIATLVISSQITGYTYQQDADGALVLVNGAPVVV